MRPHIVWFGEMPMQMPDIEKALAECVFVAIGTSGHVYPAANSPSHCKTVWRSYHRYQS